MTGGLFGGLTSNNQNSFFFYKTGDCQHVFGHDNRAFIFERPAHEGDADSERDVILNRLLSILMYERFRQYQLCYSILEYFNFVGFFIIFLMFCYDTFLKDDDDSTTAPDDPSGLSAEALQYLNYYFAACLMIDSLLMYIYNHSVIWLLKRHELFIEIIVFALYIPIFVLHFEIGYFSLYMMRMICFILETFTDVTIDYELDKELHESPEVGVCTYRFSQFIWKPVSVDFAVFRRHRVDVESESLRSLSGSQKYYDDMAGGESYPKRDGCSMAIEEITKWMMSFISNFVTKLMYFLLLIITVPAGLVMNVAWVCTLGYCYPRNLCEGYSCFYSDCLYV